MANNKCDFCGGDHTELKCPSLEGRMQHVINIINANKSNGIKWNADLSTAFDLHDLDDLWRKFTREAAKGDLLGIPHYRWWAMMRTYQKRLNYKRAGEKRRGQKRTKAIKCGYCGKSGHTRRTCSHLKHDMKILTDDTTLRRAMFLDICRDLGLGVGALVKMTLNEYGQRYKEAGYGSFQDEEFIVMLTEMPTHSISAFSPESSWSDFYERAHFLFKPLTGKNAKERGVVSLAVNNTLFGGRFKGVVRDPSDPHYNSYYDIEIVSKSSDMSWSTKDGDNYLRFLKKKPRDCFENAVTRSAKWLKENR